jgi:hypothetical protein
MHRLAKMSEVERQHLIDDFLDDTFGDTDAIPELIAMLRAMRPELPDDPTTTWTLAELLSFRTPVIPVGPVAGPPDARDRPGGAAKQSPTIRQGRLRRSRMGLCLLSAASLERRHALLQAAPGGAAGLSLRQPESRG